MFLDVFGCFWMFLDVFGVMRKDRKEDRRG